ncbi:MAG: recombinase family protein [Bacteroidota bacterium]
MKTAWTGWTYNRISQEEQSFYSIKGQENDMRYYANKYNIEITQAFADEESAKNFDRKDWQRLEYLLRTSRNKPDFIIVWAYDRLIRNAIEGLTFWQIRLKKYGVRLLSVREYSDPYQGEASASEFKRTADAFVTAEYERLRISERTKMGLYNASMEGRWTTFAPYGYDNSRDENDRPMLTVNPDAAKTIRSMFDKYLEGESFIEIRNWARKEGFALKHKQAVQRIITNPVYIGKIPVRGSVEEKTVKGLQEPIVSEDIYYRAYYKYKESTRSATKCLDKDIPLRGFLQCKCQKVFTGGPSKGRNGTYFYYRCLKCRNENYSATIVNEEIELMLEAFSMPDEIIKAMQIEFEYQVDEVMSEQEQQAKRVKIDLNKAQEKLNWLEQKWIENKISEDVYDKWHQPYSKEVNDLRDQLQYLTIDVKEKRNLFAETLPLLGDLSLQYNRYDTKDKQLILKTIFPGGLIREKKGYRTALFESLFSHNLNSIKHLLTVEMGLSSLDLAEKSHWGGQWVPNRTELVLRKFSNLFKNKAA